MNCHAPLCHGRLRVAVSALDRADVAERHQNMPAVKVLHTVHDLLDA